MKGNFVLLSRSSNGYLCRSKFGEYKDITSLDNLNFISQKGLQTSYELILRIIQSIELNKKPKNKHM